MSMRRLTAHRIKEMQSHIGSRILDYSSSTSTQSKRCHSTQSLWMKPLAPTRKALRLPTAFVEAHVNLGLLHHNAGALKEAETSCRRAVRHGPDSALAYFNLAVVLEDQADRSAPLRPMRRH
jgi:Tfp pilus assembly protein PilF